MTALARRLVELLYACPLRDYSASQFKVNFFSIKTSPRPGYLSLFQDCYPKSDTINYYQDLDLKCLKKKYLQLQTQYHPDNYNNTPHSDTAASSPQSTIHGLRESADMSAYISEAYDTMKDPVKRLIYVLEHHEKIVNLFGDERAAGEESNQKISQDPELLEQVMELHELLDELLASRGGAAGPAFSNEHAENGPRKKLLRLKESISKKQLEKVHLLGELYNSHQMDLLRRTLQEWKYLTTLLNRIHEHCIF